MKICDCHHTTTYTRCDGLKDFIKYECWGTRERDECSCGGDRTKCDFYPEVREKALQEIEPEFGEWISVQDRLPKTNGSYLCADYSKTFSKWFIRILSFSKNLYKLDEFDFPKEKGKSGFYSYDSEWGYCKHDEVTHWMPLPEPPKGE